MVHLCASARFEQPLKSLRETVRGTVTAWMEAADDRLIHGDWPPSAVQEERSGITLDSPPRRSALLTVDDVTVARLPARTSSVENWTVPVYRYFEALSGPVALFRPFR